MMDLLGWLEATALATWVRESVSLFAYPGIIAFHTVGLAFVAGGNAVVDLRLLGYAKDMPLAPLEKFFPVMWAGWWINAFTGFLLLIAYATSLMTNPVFVAKLVFIVIAIVNLRLIKVKVFGDRAAVEANRVPANARLLAVSSLTFWTLAILAGRMTAYLGLMGFGE
jgi:hypothetical protein